MSEILNKARARKVFHGGSLFFAAANLSCVGWPVLAPVHAPLGRLVLGLPATWAFARHIRRLMAEAGAAP